MRHVNPWPEGRRLGHSRLLRLVPPLAWRLASRLAPFVSPSPIPTQWASRSSSGYDAGIAGAKVRQHRSHSAAAAAARFAQASRTVSPLSVVGSRKYRPNSGSAARNDFGFDLAAT